MSNLKKFFTNEPTVSLESILEDVAGVVRKRHLRNEVGEVTPTLEAVLDGAEVVLSKGSDEEQGRFNNLVHTTLGGYGIELGGDTLAVSVEGLKEMIAKARKLFKLDDVSKEKYAVKKLRKVTLDELSKTYGNKSWLESRTFTTEPVSGNDIFPLLSRGGKLVDVSKMVSTIRASEGEHTKWLLRAFTDLRKDLDPFWKEFLTIQPEDKVKLQDLSRRVRAVKTIRERIKYDFTSLPDGVDAKYAIHGANKYASLKVVVNSESSELIPALTLDDVVSLVGLLPVLTERHLEFDDEYSAISKLSYYVAESETPPNWTRDDYSEYGSLIPYEFEYENYDRGTDTLDVLNMFDTIKLEMYKAIVTWIVRSVK